MDLTLFLSPPMLPDLSSVSSIFHFYFTSQCNNTLEYRGGTLQSMTLKKNTVGLRFLWRMLGREQICSKYFICPSQKVTVTDDSMTWDFGTHLKDVSQRKNVQRNLNAGAQNDKKVVTILMSRTSNHSCMRCNKGETKWREGGDCPINLKSCIRK